MTDMIGRVHDWLVDNLDVQGVTEAHEAELINVLSDVIVRCSHAASIENHGYRHVGTIDGSHSSKTLWEPQGPSHNKG